MKHKIELLVAVFTSSLLFAQPDENWTEVNLAVTDKQIIPRYAAFASSSIGLTQAAEHFCTALDADTLSLFQQSFHLTMDAWQQIQHVQFGPVTYFNWNFRLHYWPDENGTGVRQLDALIAGKNTELLSSENFARESVAVQGFPALERLLFSENSLLAMQSDPFRCQVANTIAQNITEIAGSVYQRWTDEFRLTIENADERGFFENAEDATIDFLKAQVEPVRRIQQQKLEQVIGESAGRTRIRRAESWRSERSIRNIRLNVLALERLFNGSEKQDVKLADVLLAEDSDNINNSFTELQASLGSLPNSFTAVLAMVDGHAQLQQLVSQLDALFEAFEAGLKNTDFYLGFNSLDGD